MRILLVNPAVYDFTAYDFWGRPYGLLRVGGLLREAGELVLFDFLDRAAGAGSERGRADKWGRGRYRSAPAAKPAAFAGIRRHYYRFGRSVEEFEDFLIRRGPFDFCLVGSVMTYWYQGVREAIGTVRRICALTKIILGGFYATACFEHASGLGADVVVRGDEFGPMYEMMGIEGKRGLPVWDLYGRLDTAVIRLSEGCPFKCSYCYVPVSGKDFSLRGGEVMAEFEALVRLGARDVAFFDDALLYRADEGVLAFLERAGQRGVNFHTPNALHTRYISRECAERMVRGGVRTFYLGFESGSRQFQEQTGGKGGPEEFAGAVESLRSAGAKEITAYLMLGHPRSEVQGLEESMRYANRLGVRVTLSDFSPLPGTVDGELARRWADIDEPLCHNKTAFPIWMLGQEKVDYYKQLCRDLNARLA